MADGDAGQADCAACGDALSETQQGHRCRTCKRGVHSWAFCEKVWQPEYGAYFCSRDCLIKYNGDAEIRSNYVGRSRALALRLLPLLPLCRWARLSRMAVGPYITSRTEYRNENDT